MTEPFDIKKALSLDLPSLGKSTSVVFKGLLVLALIAGLCLGVWIIIKPHFQKQAPTTGITGNVQTLNQDCSEQVCKAIKDWEGQVRKANPWVELRLWKILKLGIGGT